MNTLFKEQYAPLSKQCPILDLLAHFALDDCRKLKYENEGTPLGRLIEFINALVPMAKGKDREEESKERFLKDAVTGTPWALKETTDIRDTNKLQDLINALTSPQQDLSRNLAANKNIEENRGVSLRRTVWNKGASGDGAQKHDTLFIGKGRFGRDQRTVESG